MTAKKLFKTFNFLWKIMSFGLLHCCLYADNTTFIPNELKMANNVIVQHFSDNSREVLPDNVLSLLDEKNNTFLFRGARPEKDGKFSYIGLVDDIKNYLLKGGKTLPLNFKLFSTNFLNYICEHKSIEIEKQWFTKNEDKGSTWHFPLYGSLINPIYLPHDVRDSILQHHDIDGLIHLMNKLSELVNSSANLIIYMHCWSGIDRTGEASASYLMQFKGFSYKDALTLNQKIAGRDLRFESINAIRWYAYYLRDIKGITSVGEID